MPEVNFLVKKGLTVPKGSASTPAVIFDASDSNTGLYSPGADQVAISTNGSERLRVAANGQILSGSGSGASPAYSFISDPSSGLVSVSSGALGIATNGQTRTTFQGGGIDTTGGLGIGSFDSGSWTELAVRGNRSGDGSILGKFSFINNSTTSAGVHSYIDGATAGNANLIFIAGANERMRLDSSGRLGLGTSAPVSKMQVVDGDITVTTSSSFAGFNSTRAFTPSAIGQQLGRINFDAYSTGTTYVTGASVQGFAEAAWNASSAPSYLSLQTTSSGSTSPTERLRIDSAGRVGIGTNSPSASALLDVSSTTQGLLPPRMTGVQRDAISSPAAGLMIYNTTTNKLNFYNGTAWEAVTSA